MEDFLKGDGDPNRNKDRETVRQVAMYKALMDKDNSMADKLRRNVLGQEECFAYLEKDLQLSNIEEITPEHKAVPQPKGERQLKLIPMYEESLSEITVDDGGKDKKWKSSIPPFKAKSAEEEEDYQDQKPPEHKRMNLADIVENIDDLSARAQQMKITRNEYLDCLRHITKTKMLQIQEAKNIFEKRVNKLIKAQEYELQNNEKNGIMTAHKVFIEKGVEVQNLFNTEVQALQKEYLSLYDLIRFYQKKVQTLCEQLASQEVIITKLQNHIFYNMRGRTEEQAKLEESLAQSKEEENEMQKKKMNWKQGLMAKEFDFYGFTLRMQTQERERIMVNEIIRQKDELIEELKDKAEFSKASVTEVYKLFQKASEEEAKLKKDLHWSSDTITQLKREHAIAIAA